MCGIAVIVYGIRIDLSSLLPDFTPMISTESESVEFSIDDLEAVLRRRGPDSLGTKKVLLCLNSSHSLQEDRVLYSIKVEDNSRKEKPFLQPCKKKSNGIFSSDGDFHEQDCSIEKPFAELHFIGATLQLRGVGPITQPLMDSSGNILVYNGEIFGGIDVDSDSNDAEILMESLGKCCFCNSYEHIGACSSLQKRKNYIPEVLSTIKGPWALIYWQESSRTLWFGRDAFGRRSLLVHWPTLEDARFLLSSVSPKSSGVLNSDFDVENNRNSNLSFWEELPCGMYSISLDALGHNENLVGEVKRHEWTSLMLKELIKWERALVEPKPEDSRFSHCKISGDQHEVQPISPDKLPFRPGSLPSSILMTAQKVLNALKESVVRRSTMNSIFQAVTCNIKQAESVPVAVLFSGGLDSMILAALLDECLEPSCKIDLLNVSFDGQYAPDRISARAGAKELERIAPLRRWRLVEIDAELSKLTWETEHVMSLINPAKTYMDLNIGIALWLAAGGDGWVYEGINNNGADDCQRIKYKSEARILLVGSGADEQCAGYGRHKTKYKNGSWLGLHEEMKLDMQRIWKRNLGRDDRCIADNGKEARFPFLDEDVIKTLLDIPLWEVADLDQPSGLGDKKILREVANLLGLHEAAGLPKRAIQFGSRIARESNRKNFGSNRAANQASAGSAVIYGPSK